MPETTVQITTVDVVDPDGEGTAKAIQITATIPPGEPGPQDTLARWWAHLGDALRAVGHRSSATVLAAEPDLGDATADQVAEAAGHIRNVIRTIQDVGNDWNAGVAYGAETELGKALNALGLKP